jgi:multicomponent Na+:H+ antiporter subunit D
VSALVALLVLPLAGALAAVALPGRVARATAMAAIVATAGAALALGAGVASHGVLRLEVGGWAPPIGIALVADGLAVALIVMAAVVVGGVSLVARHSLAPEAAGARAAFGFWPLMLLLWSALNVVFLSSDLFNLYVGIELLSLAAIGLVAIDGRAAALAAALRYMVFALAGSLLYLAGVVLIYAAHGTLDIDLVSRRTPAAPDGLALALMTTGADGEDGALPVPRLASARTCRRARSGFGASVGAGAQGVLRHPAAALVRCHARPCLGRGARAARASRDSRGDLGSLAALAQARLKLIVAYSTVAQIGYLFLVFPLAGGTSANLPWAAGAWNGAVFIALSHGLAKAGMFLAVGHWMSAVGSDRLSDLRGLAQVMPMTAFAFALSAVTLVGLPPSGGFTGKYLLMTAGFASGQWGWALVLIVGGLLAAAYLYRPLAVLFARDARVAATPPPRARQAVPLVLAGASILLGLASAWPFAVLEIGRPLAAEEGL